MAVELDFLLLGPLEVRAGGHALPLGAPKQQALLAVLLLRASEVVSTDHLVDALWSEEPPASAAHSIQVYVSQLRKLFGDDGSVLVTRSPGYVLRVERDRLDLHRFEGLVEAAGRADAAEAAALLRDALALWRGPPLAEFAYESFAQAAIRRLEELRLTALERRIEADLELGRHAQLLAELESLAAEHPLSERLRGQLMLALYRSGRQAEALETYRGFRAQLVDELGIEPGHALQQLEREMLRHDPKLEPALSDPTGSILVAFRAEAALARLIDLAEPLASAPARELILAHLISDPATLPAASSELQRRRRTLLEGGTAARAAALTSAAPGIDIVRLAEQQDVELLLVEALEDDELRLVLDRSPCDVAVLLGHGRDGTQGEAVLVPFGGAEQDWAAVELGAWLARGANRPLRLLGASGEKGDASRLLASASLALQRVVGLAAEPLLAASGPEAVVAAAEDAFVLVLGLSSRWRAEGIGETRLRLAAQVRPPTLLVRRGPRPGGLAPRESVTRYEWSLAGVKV